MMAGTNPAHLRSPAMGGCSILCCAGGLCDGHAASLVGMADMADCRKE